MTLSCMSCMKRARFGLGQTETGKSFCAALESIRVCAFWGCECVRIFFREAPDGERVEMCHTNMPQTCGARDWHGYIRVLQAAATLDFVRYRVLLHQTSCESFRLNVDIVISHIFFSLCSRLGNFLSM